MKQYRWLILGVVVGVGALAAYLLVGRGHDKVATDLIEAFPNAVKKSVVQPPDQPFAIVSATVGHETKRSIFTPGAGRITWHVPIPDNGWISVSMALKEEAWTLPGDGVQFRIGVSDGHTYDPLLTVLLDPFDNASDRRWDSVTLDLSPYAGQTVDVIFNTDPGLPSHNDVRNDLALWGDPRIVIR
jgi:hypothetical protein